MRSLGTEQVSGPLIQSIQVHPVSFRLIQPFITAKGRKSETHNLQITVLLSNGLRGLAEASSSIAMPQATASAMAPIIQRLASDLRSRPIAEARAMIAACWERQPYHPTAVAGLECALLDAQAKAEGIPLSRLAGGHGQTVETDITLSVGKPADLARLARAAAQRGFRRFKIKLAGDARDDERIIAAARAVRRGTFVADGNQGLSLPRALEMARQLEQASVRLVFLEQPFPKHDFPSMRAFRKRCKIPLVADESVLTPADAVRLFETEAADGVNVKIAKSGFLGARDIIHTARRFRKLISIGCMEESKLGLAASVHLACGAGPLDWTDLDSVFLLEKSALRGGFSARGARLSINPKMAGIGIR